MALSIPSDSKEATLRSGERIVKLTNLRKIYFPELSLTKGDLLRYYLRMSTVLLPHLENRPMVMRRYPDGIHGKSFFMKQTPDHAPDWVETCGIEHSDEIVQYPLIQDLAALLWVVNLGCIDLNQWYSQCDDVDHPDFLHFDLDPVPGAGFDTVCEVALIIRELLEQLGMKPLAKTTGSRGIHVYVAIRRGPHQDLVWQIAKTIAGQVAARHPDLATVVYAKAKRPGGRVLVDYNQNAWGQTLASVYSVRPRPEATVSAPVTWNEIESGIQIEDFTMTNMPERIEQVGDLWKPMTWKRRFDLEKLIANL